jgi:hypothetical protein
MMEQARSEATDHSISIVKRVVTGCFSEYDPSFQLAICSSRQLGHVLSANGADIF